MPLSQLNNAVIQVSKKVPLQTVLIIPIVLQILGTVGLVGYFSFRNGTAVLTTANPPDSNATYDCKY